MGLLFVFQNSNGNSGIFVSFCGTVNEAELNNRVDLDNEWCSNLTYNGEKGKVISSVCFIE